MKTLEEILAAYAMAIRNGYARDGKSQALSQIQQLIAESLPEKESTYAPTDYGKGRDDGFNDCLATIRSELKKKGLL